MSIEVHKGLGLSEEQAVSDAAAKGLVIVVGNFDESFPDNPHWHPWDTHLYCISGEIRGMDLNNPDLVMVPGDYFVIPANYVHSAHIVKPSRIVNAFTRNVFADLEFNRSPDELSHSS